MNRVASANEAAAPADGSGAILGLPVYDGYGCLRCDFRSITRDGVRQLLARTHTQARPQDEATEAEEQAGAGGP